MGDGALLRTPDAESVTAGDNEVVDPHQLLHDETVTTADDAYRAAFGQRTHGGTHAVGHHRVLGPLDDRRQHPVVVEEHGRAVTGQPPGQLPVVVSA